jgi:hypothetical protein
VTEPLSPDRLTRLMHDAVRQVTVPPDSLDRIHHGVRRRRAVRHAGAAVLVAAVLAGGSVTTLAVMSGGGAGPGAAASNAGSAAVAAAPAPTLADPPRIQPYLPPPSLAAVTGQDVSNDGTGATQLPPNRAMPPAPRS